MSESGLPFADPEIATLAEVLDPTALAKHLQVVSPHAGNGGGADEVHVRVLQHHARRRCTLEIGLRTSEKSWHFVIGKVYHIDRADIFQAMEGMRQAGFGPQDEFSIPQPLAYLPSLHLLLQEKVEGNPTDEILKAGDQKKSAAATERCAQWLARFHARAPRTGPVSYPSDYLNSKSIRRCSRKIAKRGGSSAGKAAVLLQRLEEVAASLKPGELCAGHGSYSATHVILSRKRTIVFDWDGYDVADPARDVARFMAALRRLALGRLGSIRALDGIAEVFLKTYLAVGQPLAEKNLRFFEAAACLKLAKYNLCHPVPHWHDKTEAMLDEGLRILDCEAAG